MRSTTSNPSPEQQLGANQAIAPQDIRTTQPRATDTSTRGLRFRRAFIAAGLTWGALTFVAGDSSIYADYYYPPETCGVPSAAESLNIRQMQAVETPLVYPADSTDFIDNFDFYLDKHIRETASQYDLTVPGYREKFANLQENMYNADDPTTNREYLVQANEFLAQYGVSIELDEPHVETQEGARPLTESEINSYEFKQFIFNAVQLIGNLPVEFIKEVGLERIVKQHNPTVIDDEGTKTVDEGYVRLAPGVNTIFIGASTYGVQVLGHELGHLIDYSLLGCHSYSGHDFTWENLNGRDFEYEAYSGVDPAEAPELFEMTVEKQGEQYDKQANNLWETIHDDTIPWSEVERQREELLQLGSDLLFITNYSMHSPDEDIAETWAEVFKNIVYERVSTQVNLTSEEFPAIMAKRDAALHRLSRRMPNVMEFFADRLHPVRTLAENPLVDDTKAREEREGWNTLR